jgi:hypothetical protein
MAVVTPAMHISKPDRVNLCDLLVRNRSFTRPQLGLAKLTSVNGPSATNPIKRPLQRAVWDTFGI